MPSSKIGVQLFGKYYLRFILANDRQEYWDGRGWTPHRRKALLYYDLDLVRRDRRKLIARQKRHEHEE